MKWSVIRYGLGQVLPKDLKNSIRRWERKCLAASRNAKKRRLLSRFGSFDALELVRFLREEGVMSGGVLFVHCSFNDFYTFSGGPTDVLFALRELVGDGGTLLMPAYTSNSAETPPRLFDVASEPTNTGIVNELFRRLPGVIRSLHPRHSICGIGPLAKELLSNHHKCVRADGPGSPFDLLRLRDDSQILTLGLPAGYLSFLHWVEDIDPSLLPRPIHNPLPTLCKIRKFDGELVDVYDYLLQPDLSVKNNYESFSKHYSKKAMRYSWFKGVPIGVYSVKTLAAELLSLRDKGLTHYQT